MLLVVAVVCLLAVGGYALWARGNPAEAALLAGQWALRHGDAAGAEASFRRYTALVGNNPDSLAAVGALLIEAEQWTAAAEYLEPAVVAEPGSSARVLLGIAYEEMGLDADAEEQYREAVRRRPRDEQALNALGYFYAQRGVHLTEAVELLHRALELRPNEGNIVDSLGWALYQSGELQQALAQLHSAVESVPDSGEIRYHYGVALARAGLRDRALVELGKAVMLEPDLDPAREMLSRVRFGQTPPVPAPWKPRVPPVRRDTETAQES